jgi:hypothetical protein
MKHTPVPPEEMELTSSVLSICQVIRDIYHATDDEYIRDQCRLACAMGKAMSKTITNLTGDGFWFHGYWDEIGKEE